MRIWRTMAAAGALAALAATTFATTGASAEDVLKIGSIGTLSGGGTAWGLATKRGVEMAIDEINAKGGLKVGDKTYKLTHIMYDDQYTGAGGKTAAERLVNQDGVKFIVGPIGSPSVLATIGVTNPAKVVVLSDGYAPQILKNEAKAAYNFRITNSNLEFSPAIAAWVKKTYPNVKKIGVVAPNDAVGQSVAPITVDSYKKLGYPAWFDTYERGTKEFTPLMVRMIAEKVDLFDLDGNAPGESGLLVKQARQAGYRGIIIQSGGPAVPEIMEIAGGLANGFLSYEMFAWDSPVGKKLEAEYHKKYGAGIINSQLPAFYNATLILAEALRRAQSLDTTKVRDTLEKMDGYDAGVYGPIKWGGMENYGVNHQLMLPFYIVKVDNGKIVTLDKVTQ